MWRYNFSVGRERDPINPEKMLFVCWRRGDLNDHECTPLFDNKYLVFTRNIYNSPNIYIIQKNNNLELPSETISNNILPI